MIRCLEGFLIVRGEINKTIAELRGKIEEPATSDPEIRSYLGQIKGLKRALDLIPDKE